MDNEQTGRGWMVLAGIVLLGAGLLGFVNGNPIASSDPNAIFRVNPMHNGVHIVTGLIALGIGLGTRGLSLGNGLIGFGILYAIIAAVGLIDPTMFGMMSDAPMNAGDHVLHVVLAVVSLALGAMVRSQFGDRMRATAGEGGTYGGARSGVAGTEDRMATRTRDDRPYDSE
jgi:hypothetical protein